MNPWQPFLEELKRLGLVESEFDEVFARSGGPGGQHVNKTASAVTLKHRPSGLGVTVQEHRSQSKNRQLARQRILELIEETRRREAKARQAYWEKQRRKQSKRPTGVKKRMVEAKRKRAQIKQTRKAPSGE